MLMRKYGLFSVAAVKDDCIVGHLTKDLDSVFMIFVPRRDIICIVTGHRRYSASGRCGNPCTL